MKSRLDFKKMTEEGMLSAVKKALPDVEYNFEKFELPSSDVDRAMVIAAMLAAREWLNEAVELIDDEVSRLSHLPDHGWNKEQVERVRASVTGELSLMPTAEAMNIVLDKAIQHLNKR